MDTTSRESNPDKSFLRRENVVILLLGLATLAQLALLTSVEIRPLHEKTYSVRNLPADGRSAILGFGDNFWAYVMFLNDQIPDNATVVVPSMAIDSVFGNAALMQYFLFPRRIVNCPGELSLNACVERLGGEGVYFLATRAYHLAEQPEPGSNFSPFTDQSGVIAPQP
jgi:hypothetical protein